MNDMSTAWIDQCSMDNQIVHKIERSKYLSITQSVEENDIKSIYLKKQNKNKLPLQEGH